ncbi:hypothetical protein [Deinococcus sp. UYEF24]
MKRLFQVNVGRLRELFVKTESEYDAAQKAAEILKPGTYARKYHEKPNTWEVYKHLRGEDWAQNITFVVQPVLQSTGDMEATLGFQDNSFLKLTILHNHVQVKVFDGRREVALEVAFNPETEARQLAAFRRLCLALKPKEAIR